MSIKITKVADLISIVRTAKAGGRFVSLFGHHETKFNVLPNDEYCTTNGITLASGKGSRKANEQYRYNGNYYESRFVVNFHFGQDYDRTLVLLGLERSDNGANADREHFGSIAIGYPTTHNVCLVYMQGAYTFDGFYRADGSKVTDADELAYIKGYKSATKDNGLNYRTIGVRNIDRLTINGTTYAVEIPEITASEYELVRLLFSDRTDKWTEIARLQAVIASLETAEN